jgi:MFS family permease
MANDVTREPIGWKPIALDGGYGWVVVFGSFLIHVFADGFVYSFGVIAESLVKEFNASNAETSVILSLLTGLMLAAGPVASAICNRIGCRVTTIIGAVIASIGCALSYFATSMTYLIFSVGIIMGTGFGLMYCPAIIIVTMYFEKYRSLATGVTVCGAGVGTFVFSKIIGYLIVTFDWQTVFIIYAAVVLLCVPCGALYRPIEFEPIYADDERMNAEEETAQELANGTTDAYREKLASVASAPERRTTSVAEVLETVVDDNTATSPNETLHTFIDDSKALLSPPKGTNGVGKLRAAVSHTHVNDDGRGPTQNLQRVRSLGESLHRDNAVSVSAGYLNVRDVFYNRSVTNLPEYNDRLRSVSSLHTHKDSVKEKAVDKIDEENEDSAATSASRAIEVWRTIKKLMDLSLLADPVYLLFAISNFFTSIGFNAPPMLMPMNAESVLGFTKIDASSTVSAYGLANTLGRIAFGLICDRQLPFKYGKDRARNRLWIYNLTLMVCGIASCFVFSMTDFFSFTGYCFAFGFLISSYVCLTSVVLVDLVGVDRLTNAFGLLLLIQGIATFVGPPLAGKLYDITHRYDWTFVFCGVCLFVSGIMLFAIPPLLRRREARGEVRLEDPKSNAKRPLVH